MPEIKQKNEEQDETKVNNTKDEKGSTKKQERKRVPLRSRNVLTAPKRPGFVRRFVNDKGDRVQRFKDAGYSIVEEEIQVGDPKIGRSSQLGGDVRPHVGGGMRAVLMEIPEEFYKEDFNAAQNKISQVENEIRRDSTKETPDGLTGKVSIS